MLDEKPFSSLRSIGDELKENNVIIYRYLTKYLHKIYKHSKWVQYSLSLLQKKNRMEQSKELSQILKASKYYGFRNILTGDQKWFTLSYSNNGAWLDFDEKPPQMIDDQIFHEKVIVTIVWGVSGFFTVDFLTKGESYKSEYFIFIFSCIFPIKNKIYGKNQHEERYGSIWTMQESTIQN